MAGQNWDSVSRPVGSAAPAARPATQAAPPPIRLPYSPAKVQQQANQEREQNRADTRVGVDLEQNARAAEDHAKKMEALKANGGVETNVAQDQAAGHATQLLNNLNQIKAAGKADPQSLRPNIWEVGVGMVTDDPEALAWARKGGQGERQVVADSYNGVLDSLIYLSTGAAAPAEQMDRIKSTVVPTYFDDAKARQGKRQRLEAAIAAARLRAGPADLKTQAALAELEGSLDFLYADPDKPANAEKQRQIGDMLPPLKTVGADQFETEEFPPEHGAKHSNWIRSNPNASFDDYVAFRKGLDREYLPEENGKQFETVEKLSYNNPEWMGGLKAWYDHVQAHPELSIDTPAYTRELNASEYFWNMVGQSEPGVAAANFSNAATAGVPELLAGKKARRNFQRRNSESPWIAGISDAVGSVVPTTLVAKGLGKVLPQALDAEARMRNIAILAETGYGTARGANAAEPGNRGVGAMFGGGLSAVGAKGMQSLSSGARGGLSQRMRENLDLTSGNTEATLLQRMGKGDFEEGLQGLPLVRGARQESVEGFNQDKVRRALKLVDEELPGGVRAGTDANAKLHAILNQKYNELRPKIVGRFDNMFTRSTNTMANRVLTSGDSLKVDLFKEIQKAGAKFRTGAYDGNTFKDADQKLRQLSHDWSQVEAGPGIVNPSTYHEMAKVADKMRQQLRAQVARNDPAVGTQLKKLDTAWAHKLQIENATNRANGVYSPKQLLTTIKALDTSKGKGRSARGQALDQRYAQASEEILGSAPSKESTNLLQTSGAAYMLQKHPILLGLPASTIAGLSYTPGLKRLAKVLLTGKRGPKTEASIRALIAQNLRKYGTENREEEQ